VIAQLVGVCRERGVVIRTEGFSLRDRSRFRRGGAKLRYILRAMPLLSPYLPAVVRQVATTPWRRGSSPFRAIANWLHIIALVRWQSRARVPVVLEQGIFQSLWSVIYRVQRDARGERLIEEWWRLTCRMMDPSNIVVVIVEVEEMKLRERVVSSGRRATGRCQEGRENQASIWAHGLVVQLIEAAFARGEICSVVRVDNTTDDPDGIRLRSTYCSAILTTLRAVAEENGV
jgi:hypothetical protein